MPKNKKIFNNQPNAWKKKPNIPVPKPRQVPQISQEIKAEVARVAAQVAGHAAVAATIAVATTNTVMAATAAARAAVVAIVASSTVEKLVKNIFSKKLQKRLQFKKTQHKLFNDNYKSFTNSERNYLAHRLGFLLDCHIKQPSGECLQLKFIDITHSINDLKNQIREALTNIDKFELYLNGCEEPLDDLTCIHQILKKSQTTLELFCTQFQQKHEPILISYAPKNPIYDDTFDFYNSLTQINNMRTGYLDGITNIPEEDRYNIITLTQEHIYMLLVQNIYIEGVVDINYDESVIVYTNFHDFTPMGYIFKYLKIIRYLKKSYTPVLFDNRTVKNRFCSNHIGFEIRINAPKKNQFNISHDDMIFHIRPNKFKDNESFNGFFSVKYKSTNASNIIITSIILNFKDDKTTKEFKIFNKGQIMKFDNGEYPCIISTLQWHGHSSFQLHLEFNNQLQLFITPDYNIYKRFVKDILRIFLHSLKHC